MNLQPAHRRLATVLLALALALVSLLATAPKAHAAVTYRLPWRAGESYMVTQARHTGTPDYEYWNVGGIDFGTPVGTPIVASAAGTVVRSGWSPNGWGYHVLLRHADGNCTMYAHLSSWNVGQGQTVPAGAQLGLSGNTGNSTGPHLHWGLSTCDYYSPRGIATPNTVEYGTSFWVGMWPVSQNRPGIDDPTPAPATGTIISNQAWVAVWRGPAAAYGQVGTLTTGTVVTIQCQTYGEWVNGYYGSSNIWNRIGDGRFVPDTFTNTGVNGFVAPMC